MKEKLKKILVFLIPIIILSTILFAFFPGIMSYDSENQWNQVQSGQINNAHPFLTTYVMYLLSKIWNNPTVVALFQIIVFSLMWGAISLYIFKKNYKKSYIYNIILCFIPIIFIYAITLWKDILYSYFLLILSFMLLKGVDKKYDYNIVESLLIGFFLALTMLYRHNGIIVGILLLIVFIYKLFKFKVKFKKIFVLFLATISSFLILNLPKQLFLYEEPVQNNQASLSTADSYVIFVLSTFYNNNSITDKKDLEIMHNIVEEKIWKEYYNPSLINIIVSRPEIDRNYFAENKKIIYNLLIKYSIKKPHILIKHYLMADALLYNPYPLSEVYVFPYSEWYPTYGFYGITESKIPFLQKTLTFITKITFKLRHILYRPIYPLALSILLLFDLYKKKKIKKESFIIITPMIFNTVSLMPINVAQDLRYVYINFLTFFFVLLLYINKQKLNLKILKKH